MSVLGLTDMAYPAEQCLQYLKICDVLNVVHKI